MKKAFVLLLALAILGGAVFAEDAAYTLSGSASLTWGYDLNTENHGFTNDVSATLIIPFVAEQSSTHGEEAITGSITIEDFGYVISNDDDEAIFAAGDVSAKILFPSGLYLQIASAPSFEVAKAAQQAPLTEDDWDVDMVFPEIASSGGFAFGMDGDLSFALNIGSTNGHELAAAEAAVYDWVDTDDNPVTPPVWTLVTAAVPAEVAANDYMIGFDASYAIGELATVGASFIFGAFQADPNVVGFGVYVDATPVEGLSLYLGTDLKMSNDITGMDLQFDAGYELAELVSFDVGAYLALTDFDNPFDLNPWLTALVRVGVLAVENLTLDLGVDLWNILDTLDSGADMNILVGLDAAYKAMLSDVNYVEPYLNLSYVLEANGVDAGTVLSVGVEAMLIPMTTFALDFSAGEMDVDVLAYVTPMGSDAGQDKGVITFTTTIEY